MAIFELSEHFRYFFGRINPGSSFTSTASSQYNSIKGLIENASGPAAVLSPRCFLQGSYDQSTAIYTINDIDVIVLCELWQPGAGSGSGPTWDRDRIFATIAAPLRADGRYKDKVYFKPTSMCIKVDLGIKVEILPVVYKQGTYDWQAEPFRLFRPETGQWEDGYARYHQAHLSAKNRSAYGNFVPMIKVLKHLRSNTKVPAVSFHLECLLFSVPDYVYLGSPATYIRDVLEHLAGKSADDWFYSAIKTPCGERFLFNEWQYDSWKLFHSCLPLWAKAARLGTEALSKETAVQAWQIILGPEFFPATVS